MPDAETALAARIRALRLSAGWTQRDLSDRMSERGFGWFHTTASKVEAARRPIRVNEAAAIAELFGVTLADLLNGCARPSAGAAARQARERERRIRREAEYATRKRVAAEILSKIR
jgi:transcriptional regulator with XRE-family HTH domain